MAKQSEDQRELDELDALIVGGFIALGLAGFIVLAILVCRIIPS